MCILVILCECLQELVGSLTGVWCGAIRRRPRTVLQFASLDERYTHYFRSSCHPTCPDIQVQEIDDKWAEYISAAKTALSLDDVDVRFYFALFSYFVVSRFPSVRATDLISGAPRGWPILFVLGWI